LLTQKTTKGLAGWQDVVGIDINQGCEDCSFQRQVAVWLVLKSTTH